MKKLINIALIILFILIIFSSTSSATNLRVGDRGNGVEEVQELLYDLGYDILVDGIFAYRTRDIVEDFQSSNGLIADGIVGNKTLNLLKERTAEISYTVKAGDTLSEIALKFDSSTRIISKRNNLPSDRIVVGQEIFIPKAGRGDGREEVLYSTVNHQVRAGDSLSVIAQRHGSSVNSIKEANNLRNDRIVIGQRLTVPHRAEGNVQNNRETSTFIWPVRGRITSPYGYRTHPITGGQQFHGGIDIAVPTGTEVKASAAGSVVQSGWSGGFGQTVVLDHGEGVRTLYAHNSRLLVSPGDRVKQGDIIALAGSTGQSTGPHVDFRIYFDGKTVDPIDYLP
ncbi:peptidoglycan DD-metalloendopeptidase family protein [Natronospora cellulosivora (SeqCode)]